MKPLVNIKTSDAVDTDYPIYKDKDYCTVSGIYFVDKTEKNYFDLEKKIQNLNDDINQLNIELENYKGESEKNYLNIIKEKQNLLRCLLDKFFEIKKILWNPIDITEKNYLSFIGKNSWSCHLLIIKVNFTFQ